MHTSSKESSNPLNAVDAHPPERAYCTGPQRPKPQGSAQNVATGPHDAHSRKRVARLVLVMRFNRHKEAHHFPFSRGPAIQRSKNRPRRLPGFLVRQEGKIIPRGIMTSRVAGLRISASRAGVKLLVNDDSPVAPPATSTHPPWPISRLPSPTDPVAHLVRVPLVLATKLCFEASEHRPVSRMMPRLALEDRNARPFSWNTTLPCRAGVPTATSSIAVQ